MLNLSIKRPRESRPSPASDVKRRVRQVRRSPGARPSGRRRLARRPHLARRRRPSAVVAGHRIKKRRPTATTEWRSARRASRSPSPGTGLRLVRVDGLKLGGGRTRRKGGLNPVAQVYGTTLGRRRQRRRTSALAGRAPRGAYLRKTDNPGLTLTFGKARIAEYCDPGLAVDPFPE